MLRRVQLPKPVLLRLNNQRIDVIVSDGWMCPNKAGTLRYLTNDIAEQQYQWLFNVFLC
jgi:hypothetical protein